MTRTRPAADEGASLLVVLVFLALVSVVTLSLLSYTQVGFKVSAGLRVERSANHTADAGVDYAIAQVLKDKTGEVGAQGDTGCKHRVQGLNGTAVDVTCTPVGTAGSWNSNRPRNALLTLSGDADSLTLDGEHPLEVDGPVYSAGGVTTMPSSKNILNSSWTVRAVKGCNDPSRVTADRGAFCPSPATAAGELPTWKPAAVTSTVITAVKECKKITTGVGKGKKGGSTVDVAVFDPGTYLVSPVAMLLASTKPGCKDVTTLHFPSGVYAFIGVPFETLAYDVVAGEATGSWAATDGSACDKGSSKGTQFVLDPTSSFVVSNEDSTVSMCPGAASHAGQPAISIYATTSPTTLIGTAAVTTARKPSVFMYGTMFTPTRTADLHLHNNAKTYFRLGIVAYELTARVSASIKMSDSPISIPPCSSTDVCRSNRRLMFTAVVDGEERLRSVVALDDKHGAQPAHGYATESWSVTG